MEYVRRHLEGHIRYFGVSGNYRCRPPQHRRRRQVMRVQPAAVNMHAYALGGDSRPSRIGWR